MEPAKLLYISPSTRKDKKYAAHFSDGFVAHFGQYGADDYTIHKNKERRTRYLIRHSNEHPAWYDNPYSPAALSRWLLWEKPDINDAIIAYKNRFRI